MKLALLLAIAVGAYPQGVPVDLLLLESGLSCGAIAGTSNSAVAVGASINVGTAAAGDCVEVRLRLRIRETAVLRQLYAASDAAVFSVENEPSLPYTMAAGTNVDFRVRFAPGDPGSFKGTLYFFDKRVDLTASSPDGVTVQVQSGAGWETLQTTSSPVDFGSVERKQSVVRQFALVNHTGQQLTVSSVFVTGSGYALEELTVPVTLGALTSKMFAVRFTPLKSGVPLRGTLSVDGRVFSVEGFATEPPFPVISFEVPAGVKSGQQIAVKIKLSEASRAVGSVKLTLAGLEQDSSVALLPGGGRTASLALAEGATELTQMLQTGTTQGTLKLSAELAALTSTQKIEAQIVLEPLVPVFSTVTASRVSGRVELRVTGFDNTRGMKDASFQFYDAAGSVIGGAIPASLTEAFGKYFAGTTPGGTFALGASFPVQGDITQVKAVDVQLTNSQGAAAANRTTF